MTAPLQYEFYSRPAGPPDEINLHIDRLTHEEAAYLMNFMSKINEKRGHPPLSYTKPADGFGRSLIL